MRSDRSNEFDALRSVVGARLIGLVRQRFLVDGRQKSERDDGPVELRFDYDRTLVFSLATDGDSVRAEEAKLEIPATFDREGGPSFAFERVELGRTAAFRGLLGRSVRTVQAVIDTWSHPPGVEVISGWIVRFDGGRFIAYQNVGDVSRLLADRLIKHPDPETRTRIATIWGSSDGG